MKMKHVAPAAYIVVLGLVLESHASVVTYTNKTQWQLAVSNNYATVNFVGVPPSTIMTTQYNGVGVAFTDGNDYVNVAPSYLNDGAGLAGNFSLDHTISVNFGAPQRWIAADFPGDLAYRLYRNGSLIYTSPEYLNSGTGFFYGLVSDEWFDRAVLFRTVDGPYIDDLYYQQAPAPGAFGVFVITALLPARRRRL